MAETTAMPDHKTISSLAILKVHFDEYGADYLDHLLPFVRYVIAEQNLQIVAPAQVADHLLENFGLTIPDFVCAAALKRLTKPRYGYLRKEAKTYIVEKAIDTSSFKKRKEKVTKAMEALVDTVTSRAQQQFNTTKNSDYWERLLLAFLDEYSISCVASFSAKRPLPEFSLDDDEKPHLYIVARILEGLRHEKSNEWSDFESVVKGRLLANALVCDDLSRISTKFTDLYFYVDTPLVLSLLGLTEKYSRRCIKQLLKLVKDLGGKWRVFGHTIEETENVINFASSHFNNPVRSNPLIRFAIENNLKPSDLELIKGKIEKILNQNEIAKIETPGYVRSLKLDETALNEALNEEVGYGNPRALEFDVKSLSSIVVLRGGAVSNSLEQCKHIFVTPNTKVAQVAWKQAIQEDSAAKVGPAISDYSLMNISWLKSPLSVPELPNLEFLATCFAAMEPKEQLWDKYFLEIERLKQKGDISADDHALLRCSPEIKQELMNLTQGAEVHLKSPKIYEILENVKTELKADEARNTVKEKSRADIAEKKLRIREESIKTTCGKISSVATAFLNTIASIILGSIILLPIFGFESENNWWKFLLAAGAVFGLLNWLFGISVFCLGKQMKSKISGILEGWFLG